MGSLWASDDLSVWQESLAHVGKRLQALEDPKLVELERHAPDNLTPLSLRAGWSQAAAIQDCTIHASRVSLMQVVL